VVLDVEAEYLQNVPAIQKTGKNSGKPYVFNVRQLDELNVPLTATNNAFTFDIDDRTGVLLKSLFMATLTAGAGDDAPLANGSIKLKAGSLYYINSVTPILKANVRDDYFIPPASEDVGVNFINLLYDGKLSTGIPTGQIPANLQMVLDATLGAGPTSFLVQRESWRAPQFT